MLITVSRQTGSMGEEITHQLARNMNIRLLTRDMAMSNVFPDVASRHEMHMLAESPAFFLAKSSEGLTFAEHLEIRLKAQVEQGPVIIFGMGAQIVFADHPNALHVRITASPQVRIQRIIEKRGLELRDAERFMTLSDRKHKRYISTIYSKDWSDPFLYNVILNTDNLGIDEAAQFIQCMAEHRQSSALPSEVPAAAEEQGQQVIFKHPSEEEFARILDMHGLDWEYEPRTFPIQWDAEGNVTQAFSPDFYLPKFDTYIELTTMDQRYVAQKKKKVQALRKLYPGTNVNIVFKRDFNTLVKRFGLMKEAESNE